MSSLSHRILRLPVRIDRADTPVDADTGGVVRLWAGSPARLRFAFFNGDTLLGDFSGCSGVTVQLKALGAGGAPPLPTDNYIAEAVVTQFNAALTQEEWEAGTAWHAEVAFAGASLNYAAGTYWLVVVALLDQPTTLLAGKCEILQDGYGSGAVAVLQDLAFAGEQRGGLVEQRDDDEPVGAGGVVERGTGKGDLGVPGCSGLPLLLGERGVELRDDGLGDVVVGGQRWRTAGAERLELHGHAGATGEVAQERVAVEEGEAQAGGRAGPEANDAAGVGVHGGVRAVDAHGQAQDAMGEGGHGGKAEILKRRKAERRRAGFPVSVFQRFRVLGQRVSARAPVRVKVSKVRTPCW